MHARWLLVVLLVCDCTRGVRAPFTSLEGLTLPLVSSPALRVLIEGRLHGLRAQVQLDPGAAMSFVTTGCKPSPLGTRVKAADPFGPDETFSVASVEGLELGSARLAAFAPGLIEGHGCLVVLGDDVLKGLALEVSVGARTVTFRRSAAPETWLSAVPAGDEVQALPLTRDVQHDWPLLAVQVGQGSSRLTGALLFSARESRTRLFEAPARAAGLRPGLELLQGLPLPTGVALPKRLEAVRGFVVDQVELSPGFGVSRLMLDLEPGAPPHTPLGVLGADVWGRFDSIIDVSGGVLVLHRPRVLTSGARAQCERGGALNEGACFELHTRALDAGVEVGLVTWRALPQGGRLSVDLEGVDPATPCRVGITFSAGDRGRSVSQVFPWGRLKEVLPTCSEALSHATGGTPGLFEEGSLEGCAGTCAFAHELASGRFACECQPTQPGLDATDANALLDLYRQALETTHEPNVAEPADP